MPPGPAPFLIPLVEAVGDGLLWVQVWIAPSGSGFELRHEVDRGCPEAELERHAVAVLGDLAQTTADGAFRPLKAAPTLRRGWRADARSAAELAEALDRLYPGTVADWFVLRSGRAIITPFLDFTSRQSGMYRVVHLLDDPQAARVIRSGCGPRFCLKRRLWTAAGVDPDAPEAKSIAPCLEPCALLLEFARIAARIEQKPARTLALAPDEAASLLAAAEAALARPAPGLREADLQSPLNPRRLQLMLEKHRGALGAPPADDEPD